MSAALRGAQVVILSSIDWDAAWQRHQAFASLFAAAGFDVFFVENSGFRNPEPADVSRLWGKLRRIALPAEDGLPDLPRNLKVVPPRLLPPTFGAFRRINAAVLVPQLLGMLRDLGLGPNPAVVTYFATSTTLELIRGLEPSLLVYDCASNFRAHPSAPRDFPKLEARLLGRADLVVCDSDFLYEQKRAEHPRVVQIHQGVPERFFRAAPPSGAWRRFCYFGTWSRDLRADLPAALAGAGFEVSLLGFIKGRAPLPAGVRRLDPAGGEKLVRRLEGFDAFLLPYRINPFLLGVIPAKIYECLAMGRPVLATPLPSLKALGGLLHLADDPRDWIRIAKGLPETETPALREARVSAAREHLQEREFERLLSEMGRARPARRPPSAGPAEQPWWAGAHVQAFLEGFTWIGFLYGAAKASTLVTQVLAGRWLGPIEYGKANLVAAAAAFLQIAPMLGFPLALSKFLSEEREEERRKAVISTTLSAFLLWGTLCAAGLAVFRAWVARRLSVPPDLFIESLLFACCTALYVTLSSPLLGLKRFAERGLGEILYGLSAPVFLLLLAFLHRTPDYRAMILALCLSLALGSLYAAGALRGYLRPAFRPELFRPILGYALMASLNYLTAAFVLGPGRLLLNRHFTAREVGVFSAYFTSSAQVGMALLYILSSVLVPVASSPEGQAKAWRAFRMFGGRLVVGAMALFTLLSVAALSLFGRKYPFRWDWTLLFSFSATLILAHGVISALFSARDFSGLRVSVAGGLIAGLGNILLGVFLIPRWGIAGAGAALAGAYVAGLGYYAAVMRKK